MDRAEIQRGAAATILTVTLALSSSATIAQGPAPTGEPSTDVQEFEFVRVIAEGVDIVDEPGGQVVNSTNHDLGRLMLVRDRREIDGVEWLRIEHGSRFGLWPRFGWIPVEATATTPEGPREVVSVEPAAPDCGPVLSGAVTELTAQPPWVRLACAGESEITLSPAIVRDEGRELGQVVEADQDWLVADDSLKLYGRERWNEGPPLIVHVDPGSDIVLPEMRWLEVSGRFDHPAARGCTFTSVHEGFQIGDPADQELWCRQQFVVTGYREVAAPSPSPSPEPAPVIGGRWKPIMDAPSVGRAGHDAFWTGEEMLVWGGGLRTLRTDRRGRADPDRGLAYDPRKDRWRVITSAPIRARSGQAVTWTGEEMLIWGGQRKRGWTRAGAAYDPTRDHWRKLPKAPLSGESGLASAWTGTEWVILEGVTDVGGPITLASAAYDPVLDRWRSLPELVAPASWSVVPIWAGDRLIVIANPNVGSSAVFELEGETWRRLEGPDFDGLNAGEVAIWTGQEIFFPVQFVLYDPLLERWRRVEPHPGCCWDDLVWTGSLALPPRGRGFAYDLEADRWLRVKRSGDRFREFETAVWTGDRMIIWGGSGGGGSLEAPPDGISFIPDLHDSGPRQQP